MEQSNRGHIHAGRVDHRVELKQSTGTLIYSRSTKRYLFLLRNGSKYSGSWGLVGGKIEKDEKITDALYREITEEIGCNLQANKIIPIETFTSRDSGFVYYTYLISVDHEFVPALNAEHRGYCWVSLQDHPNPLHPGVWKMFNFAAVVDKIKTLESIL